jgi:hypothetical protein
MPGAINKSPKSKKSTTRLLVEAVLFGIGFAFSFDYPGWAKGNILICFVFFVRKKITWEISPAFKEFFAYIYQILGGEVKFQECGLQTPMNLPSLVTIRRLSFLPFPDGLKFNKATHSGDR